MPNNKEIAEGIREAVDVLERIRTVKKECEDEFRKILSLCLIISLSMHTFFIFKIWEYSLGAGMIVLGAITSVIEIKASWHVFPTAWLYQEGHPIGSRMKEPASEGGQGTSPPISSRPPTRRQM